MGIESWVGTRIAHVETHGVHCERTLDAIRR